MIVKHLSPDNQPDKADLLEAKMHQYPDALNTKINKNHTEIKELIHNLSKRVDKLENKRALALNSSPRPSYVYLIRKVGTNEYKIGKSIDPEARLKLFKQGGTEAESILIIEFPNDETAFLWGKTLQHTSKNLRLQGDWFILQAADVEMIKKISETFEGFYDQK